MINSSRPRHTRSLFAAVALSCVALLPSLSHGQAGSSVESPFRAGQMGVEFGVGGNFASVGLLRFSTPRRAVLFDIRAEVGRVSSDYSGGQIGGSQDEEKSATDYRLGARLGVRSYRAVTSRVERFGTLGVQAEVAKTNSTPSLQPFSLETTSGGAFAELGAAWMVTPNLSLGAVWNASLLYSSFEREYGTLSSLEAKESSLRFSLGTVAIRANLYF